jgi:hypothetical protein
MRRERYLYFPGLLFDPENGSDIFLRNIKLFL